MGRYTESEYYYSAPSARILTLEAKGVVRSVFDAEAAIEVLLESENPHLYWSQILDALGDLKTRPYEINKELRAVKWLPIDIGRSPQEVIFLEGMEAEVARIVAQSHEFC